MSNEIEYVDLYLHGSEITDNVLTEPLELFFQEIELALQIGPEEVWGVKEAIKLSRYVFNKYVTITQIRNEISGFINNNCEHAHLFNYTISVETLKNSNGSDLIYIVCSVEAADQNGETQTYKQKFLLGA